jgi:hypothetical protein
MARPGLEPGTHDFQSWGQTSLTGPKSLQTREHLVGSLREAEARYLRTFAVRLGTQIAVGTQSQGLRSPAWPRRSTTSCETRTPGWAAATRNSAARWAESSAAPPNGRPIHSSRRVRTTPSRVSAVNSRAEPICRCSSRSSRPGRGPPGSGRRRLMFGNGRRAPDAATRMREILGQGPPAALAAADTPSRS